ncbi:MAG: dihydroneopterin aldolase [Sulfuritalea sp.]|nr:dihydroneopterin aldolase [Sulfuritalea sp.]
MNASREVANWNWGQGSAFVHDTIFIRHLRLDAHIGVYEWEKKSPQPVVFDIEFSLPSRDACNTDRIEDTVDYGEVIQLIRNFSLDRSFNLVEAMAESLADEIKRRFLISCIHISITKVAPFPGVEVGVCISR